MATIDVTHGKPGIPYEGKDRHYRLANRIDFSAANGASADVIQVLPIKAGTRVQAIYVKMVKPEGAAATATLGDTADTGGWLATVDLNGATGTISATLSTDAYGTSHKVYTADATIDLIPDAALDACVIDVYADCLDLN